MALGAAGGWAALISGVIGVGTQADASNKQKAAAKDQKDEQAIQRNKQASDDAQQRRADIRQERIRRAHIMQAAANSGAAGSSGEANSISNLSANIGANLSGISHGAQTADQMSFMENKIQGNIDSANQSIATGQTLSGFIDAGIKGWEAGKTAKDSTPKSKLTEYKPQA